MADYAAEIEVRSDGEAEREEIANYDEAQDYLDYLANGTYPAGDTKAEKGVIRKRAKRSMDGVLTTRGLWRLDSWDLVIVVLYSYIRMIIVYDDLNAREFLHGDAKFTWEFWTGMPNWILHGGAKFSTKFFMGMSNSLFGGGCQKHWGVPKSLEDLTQGCCIPYDTRLNSNVSSLTLLLDRYYFILMSGMLFLHSSRFSNRFLNKNRQTKNSHCTVNQTNQNHVSLRLILNKMNVHEVSTLSVQNPQQVHFVTNHQCLQLVMSGHHVDLSRCKNWILDWWTRLIKVWFVSSKCTSSEYENKSKWTIHLVNVQITKP